MRDDYLWDRSGEPDPEVEQLERLLARLGHRDEVLERPETLEVPAGAESVLPPPGAPAPERSKAPALGPAPARGPRGAGAPRFVWPRERPALPRDMRVFGIGWRALAVAAGLLVLAGAVALGWMASRPQAWEVARLEGAPRVGESPIAAAGRLAEGQWLVTDAGSRARVAVGKIGEVLVEPNTRLRLVEAGERQHRLHLALGTVTAVVLAPPRRFVVETPSAETVDLGCAYTLEVDAVGGALVTVVAGWVSFEREGRESFIPAGARCATRPGFGPGTPCFTDASDAFKNALAAVDIATDEAARAAALPAVLSQARREDALTLWHLLARLKGDPRDAVYERLAVLIPPPAGVTRAGVMAGDRTMLDRWWERLGYGEMKWWRLWQRSWPRPAEQG